MVIDFYVFLYFYFSTTNSKFELTWMNNLTTSFKLVVQVEVTMHTKLYYEVWSWMDVGQRLKTLHFLLVGFAIFKAMFWRKLVGYFSFVLTISEFSYKTGLYVCAQ
jgi:hypothetical protein